MQLNTHINEWVQYIFQSQFVVQSRRNQHRVKTSIVFDQPQRMSSPKLVTNRGRDVRRGIQPKFVYQSTSLDYYETVENWEVEENTNINVVEEIKEKLPTII
jgi:hypothetical protein